MPEKYGKDSEYIMIDTAIRKGGRRRGLTTKIHMRADANDAPQAELLLEGRAGRVIAAGGYDGQKIMEKLGIFDDGG